MSNMHRLGADCYVWKNVGIIIRQRDNPFHTHLTLYLTILGFYDPKAEVFWLISR